MENRASWRKFAATGVWLTWVVLVPTWVYAQQSSITGVVKDASGAVLPGVTVEAALPQPDMVSALSKKSYNFPSCRG